MIASDVTINMSRGDKYRYDYATAPVENSIAVKYLYQEGTSGISDASKYVLEITLENLYLTGMSKNAATGVASYSFSATATMDGVKHRGNLSSSLSNATQITNGSWTPNWAANWFLFLYWKRDELVAVIENQYFEFAYLKNLENKAKEIIGIIENGGDAEAETGLGKDEIKDILDEAREKGLIGEGDYGRAMSQLFPPEPGKSYHYRWFIQPHEPPGSALEPLGKKGE